MDKSTYRKIMALIAELDSYKNDLGFNLNSDGEVLENYYNEINTVIQEIQTVVKEDLSRYEISPIVDDDYGVVYGPYLDDVAKRLNVFVTRIKVQFLDQIIISANYDLGLLHKSINTKCRTLFYAGQYAEAVEKSFKIVKDKLRSLSGFEKGSDAFGKGKLHILGASAENVVEDFNEGVKFLTMAIDRFRNEKSHTSDAKIEDPQRAYEYMCLSSLALNLLENSTIKS